MPCLPQDGDFLEEICRERGGVKAKEIAQLAGGDHHRDADGETVDHRLGHLGDQPARAEQGRDQQDHSGHAGRHQQPFVTVFRDNAINQHDEGAGRPADLDLAAAQR